MERFSTLKVEISKDEKQRMKVLAKSKGMTLSGWLGQLIKRELAYSNASTPSSSTEHQVFPHEPLESEGSFHTGRD